MLPRKFFKTKILPSYSILSNSSHFNSLIFTSDICDSIENIYFWKILYSQVIVSGKIITLVKVSLIIWSHVVNTELSRHTVLNFTLVHTSSCFLFPFPSVSLCVSFYICLCLSVSLSHTHKFRQRQKQIWSKRFF